MFIRTQKKRRIVNIKDFKEISIEEFYFSQEDRDANKDASFSICVKNADGEEVTVGIYSTEEIAIMVGDMLCSFIDGKYDTAIFIMPQDCDVEEMQKQML